MKRLKRIVTLTMTLLLISTLAQATVFETIDGLKYSLDTLNNEASLITNNHIFRSDIVIPEKITSGGKEYTVTSIGKNCFEYNEFTSITIPSSVKSLENYCFSRCKYLTSITIPSSVTSLGACCFVHCSALTSVSIPSSITYLDFCCFYDCPALTSITIPSSVTSLDASCFANCSGLTSLTIPSSVTSLGDHCFSDCSGLTSVIIPSSVTSFGDNCFAYCSGLNSVTIPSSVKSIEDNCFYNCEQLSSIIIPSSVTSLGNSCFSRCFKLTSISCLAITPPVCTISSFKDLNTLFCNLYVPQESINQYKATYGWKSFSNIYALENTRMNSTSTQSIVATCNNGIITISGLNAQENVTFYTVNGEQLGSAAAVDGTATFAVKASSDIVIAKFGGMSMKIATK